MPNILLFMVGLVFIGNISTLIEIQSISKTFRLASSIASVISIPVIFGIYTEVINKEQTSIVNLFKVHFLNYILFTLILIIPIIFYSFITMTYDTYADTIYIKLIISIATQVLFIYSLPMLFDTKKVKSSLVNGFKFLFENFRESHALIFLLIISKSIYILTIKNLFFFSTDSTTFLHILSFFIQSISLFLSFYVFNLAFLIIKGKEGITNG